MPRALTISEVRNNLTKFPGRLKNDPEPVEITQRGKPVMALMSWDLFESLMETMEVMADEQAMKSLRKSIREIREGRTFTTREVEKRLGL